MSAITLVKGTITTADGEHRQFQIAPDGYSQWGNTTERMGETVDAVTDMLAALDNHFEEDDDTAGADAPFDLEHRLSITARRGAWERAYELASNSIRSGLSAGLSLGEVETGVIFDEERRIGTWRIVDADEAEKAGEWA